VSTTLDTSSPWFAPLAPMLARLPLDPIPDAETLQAALGERVAPFRFEPQTKKRARGTTFTLDDLYEARIARRRVIPTRRNAHDFMNALVWATFPLSKTRLAERQYRALVAQVGEHPTRLPNARTRERDVLAMIDEGGVVVMDGARILFGHAVYEHLATTSAPVRGFPIALCCGTSTDEIDAALASWIDVLDTDATRPEAVAL